MKRGSLFFIGLVSAIITVISLNYAFGRSAYYNDRYPYFNRYHRCYDERYNRRNDGRQQRNNQRIDSTTGNY